DPRGVRERTDLVRYDADRQCHQRNPQYVATSVASEEVPRLAIGLRVLVRDQLVEERDHLLAAYLHLAERDVEDEVVSADVPDEPVRLVRLHDVAQNPREHADDAVALVVTVAVVVLLEVVEVRVADRELLPAAHPLGDVALDLCSTR